MKTPLQRKRRPTHPGEALREEFLPALGISKTDFANRIGVSRQTVHELLAERRGVSADMALRLAKFFNTSAQMWLGLQEDVDLWDAMKENRKAYEKIESAAV
jgi:addiction module HigA family antidote